MSPWASETLGCCASRTDRQVESRGLHRTRRLHRRRLRGRLQRARQASGRPLPAEVVQAVRRVPGDTVHPAAAGHVLARQRREDISSRLLPGAHRLLAEHLLAAARAASSSTYWVRGAGAAGAAQGSAVPQVANIYLVASAAGVAACLVRLATAFIPPLQAIDGGTTLVWVFACMCGAGFALTSAESWRNKTKWFTNANR